MLDNPVQTKEERYKARTKVSSGKWYRVENVFISVGLRLQNSGLMHAYNAFSFFLPMLVKRYT